MAVLLSLFDTRLGPIAFMVRPKNFNKEIIKETAKLMDFMHDQEFFVQENPEEGMKSINMAFQLPSRFARGKSEILQLSILSSDESPPIDKFKEKMDKLKNELLDDEEIFMAFYIGRKFDYVPQAEKEKHPDLEEKITRKYAKLENLLEEFNDNVKIESTTTHAYHTRISTIDASEQVIIPRAALNELKELARIKGKESVFTVFRKVGDFMKMDIIPCEGQVIKIHIIVKELTPELIMKTSKIIGLPLLFTSGICQEKAGKCSYEAYFSIQEEIESNKARIEKGLRALEYVESVDIKHVQKI